MTKKVILTGLRANNDLHIGHIFGAIKPIVDMAVNHSDTYQINLFVPDLHSFTTPIDHSSLQDGIMNNLKYFVAAGLPLDNENVNIYRQSFIPAHSELTWILDCFAGFGELSRMTQFKDKSSKLSDKRISVGLFNYPVLMASDILLYNASYVPVGDDQSQHLEFTRDLAQRFNSMFGDIFTIPLSVKEQHAFFGKQQGLRIKDLVDSSKKMSKSDETGKGVLFLNDSKEAYKKKIMSATTDNLAVIIRDYINQPGVSNLLDLLDLLGGNSASLIGTSSYGALKNNLYEKFEKFMDSFEANLLTIDNDKILKKLINSEERMRDQANKTLLSVQKVIGLR